jgi:hypothetical protein
MSEKFYIEVDAGTWLTRTGAETTVFLGDACEPCFTNKESYEELIDKELEAYCIHGKFRKERDINLAGEFVDALEEAAVYARKRFEELKDE